MSRPGHVLSSTPNTMSRCGLVLLLACWLRPGLSAPPGRAGLGGPGNDSELALDETLFFTDLWSAVSRRPAAPDSVLPRLCPSPCDRLFNAQRNANLSSCACTCPEDMPIFLQTLGQCIQRIGEWQGF